MIRQYGRILNLPRHRLIYRVFSWDRDLNINGIINTWSNEVKTVLYEHDMNHIYDFQQIFSIKGVVSKLRLSMAKKQQNEIKIECEKKPKPEKKPNKPGKKPGKSPWLITYLGLRQH